MEQEGEGKWRRDKGRERLYEGKEVGIGRI